MKTRREEEEDDKRRKKQFLFLSSATNWKMQLFFTLCAWATLVQIVVAQQHFVIKNDLCRAGGIFSRVRDFSGNRYDSFQTGEYTLYEDAASQERIHITIEPLSGSPRGSVTGFAVVQGEHSVAVQWTVTPNATDLDVAVNRKKLPPQNDGQTLTAGQLELTYSVKHIVGELNHGEIKVVDLQTTNMVRAQLFANDQGGWMNIILYRGGFTNTDVNPKSQKDNTGGLCSFMKTLVITGFRRRHAPDYIKSVVSESSSVFTRYVSLNTSDTATQMEGEALDDLHMPEAKIEEAYTACAFVEKEDQEDCEKDVLLMGPTGGAIDTVRALIESQERPGCKTRMDWYQATLQREKATCVQSGDKACYSDLRDRVKTWRERVDAACGKQTGWVVEDATIDLAQHTGNANRNRELAEQYKAQAKAAWDQFQAHSQNADLSINLAKKWASTALSREISQREHAELYRQHTEKAARNKETAEQLYKQAQELYAERTKLLNQVAFHKERATQYQKVVESESSKLQETEHLAAFHRQLAVEAQDKAKAHKQHAEETQKAADDALQQARHFADLARTNIHHANELAEQAKSVYSYARKLRDDARDASDKAKDAKQEADEAMEAADKANTKAAEALKLYNQFATSYDRELETLTDIRDKMVAMQKDIAADEASIKASEANIVKANRGYELVSDHARELRQHAETARRTEALWNMRAKADKWKVKAYEGIVQYHRNEQNYRRVKSDFWAQMAEDSDRRQQAYTLQAADHKAESQKHIQPANVTARLAKEMKHKATVSQQLADLHGQQAELYQNLAADAKQRAYTHYNKFAGHANSADIAQLDSWNTLDRANQLASQGDDAKDSKKKMYEQTPEQPVSDDWDGEDELVKDTATQAGHDTLSLRF